MLQTSKKSKCLLIGQVRETMDMPLRQWRGCLVGIMLGVCIAYFFEAFGPQTRRVAGERKSIWNSPVTSSNRDAGDSLYVLSELTSTVNVSQQIPFVNKETSKKVVKLSEDTQLELLLALWEASESLAMRCVNDSLLKKYGVVSSNVPLAPHLENCKAQSAVNRWLDNWRDSGSRPPWSLWKGERFGLKLDVESLDFNVASKKHSTNLFPPWIVGVDEENLPMTRKAQQDIWFHQHLQNCKDPEVRFLLADWETDPGFGLGAQIVSMAGMLAIAINEKRVLVSNYFNRADHDGCADTVRSLWSCYFHSETSKECRDQALLLANNSTAWSQGLITGKNNYSSRQIWKGKTPMKWGKPWEAMQPTTEIDGTLLLRHKGMDRRWWRAQAVRYFMRFKSEYMCFLLNSARHTAFGKQAAQNVVESLPPTWPQASLSKETDINRFIWEIHGPWVPRPLVSIHVRQGDKAQEMKVASFEDYMKLAQHLRSRFPHVCSIWLSTEMQEVIDESKQYTRWWDIYYTNISRQTGSTSMPDYEASLGRELSTNYPLVNFLLASDADFFIGALGSTWCFLIDGMRTTGGRVMAGYLSVNKYRFW